jgi:hypothetical protein
VEFCKDGRVLGREGNDPKPPKSFWDVEVIPSHFTLATVAGFITCPKKGASSFVNSLNNTCREEPRAHGMGERRSKDRVNQDQAAANGKTTSSPIAKSHVALSHDGGEVPKAQLVGKSGRRSW